MNRLQNLVLVIWGIILLLLVAFNWQMIWKPVDLVYLFMDFKLRLILWLVVAGFGVPLALRLIAAMTIGSSRRRADKEISVIKAKAFDGVTGEFERLVNEVKAHVDERIRSIRGPEAPEAGDAKPVVEAEPEKPPAKDDEPEKKDGAWRALSGAAPADDPPGDESEEEEEGEDASAGEEKKPARGRGKG